MAVPVIESQTTDTTAGSESTSPLNFTSPSGLASGDLILVVAVSENTNTDDWNAVTGYTRISVGDIAQDVQPTMYWRIATGDSNDGFSGGLDITQSAAGYAVGWCLRISDVDGTNPIHKEGSVNTGSWTSADTNEVITTLDNCLIISVMGLDGSDLNLVEADASFSLISGGALSDPAASASGVEASLSTRSLATAGGSTNCSYTWDADDGFAGFQIAISEPQAGGILPNVHYYSQS